MYLWFLMVVFNVVLFLGLLIGIKVKGIVLSFLDKVVYRSKIESLM